MNYGLIDADLLDNGTHHPNLALMKLSGYLKNKGENVKLILDYKDIIQFDHILISKVFTKTEIPKVVLRRKNISYGGSGFLGEYAPYLIREIEFHMPDYELYNEYVTIEKLNGRKNRRLNEYIDYSIGFTTRGCFRHCDFCINKKYRKVERHSLVKDFFDPKRKYIYLWDDNFLGYSRWDEVLDELDDIGRPFQFRQGLDIRLLNEDKAKRLAKSMYHGDFIFAFDFIHERPIIEKKLKLWRSCTNKKTKLYLLCAYESIQIDDIINTFERIKVLMEYQCVPYIMRYENYINSEHKGIYINLARWCNQPAIFKKMSFREFCLAHPPTFSTQKYYFDFINKFPEVSSKYFDMKFSNFHF